MRFGYLGSGSKGNAYIVECAETTLLIDCGFSAREVSRRLARFGVLPANIDALLVSHEHTDHTKGLAVFVPDGMPLYMTRGTAGQLRWQKPYHRIRAEASFTIGDIEIHPIAVPHDAAEPVQFIFHGDNKKLGVFTDLGYISPTVKKQSAGVHALVTECNYCPDMLAQNTRYPEYLKERITGRYGHLDNKAGAMLARFAQSPQLQFVVAAHMSQNNNSVSLVEQALQATCAETKVIVATQQDGTDWLTL